MQSYPPGCCYPGVGANSPVVGDFWFATYCPSGADYVEDEVNLYMLDPFTGDWSFVDSASSGCAAGCTWDIALGHDTLISEIEYEAVGYNYVPDATPETATATYEWVAQ